MKCENCKNGLPKNAKFCGKCGQKVETATKATPKENTGGIKSLLCGAVAVIVFILTFVAFRYLMQVAIFPSSNLNTQNSTSRAKLIEDTLREVKSTIALPYQVDEVTVWNDVTSSTKCNSLPSHSCWSRYK